MATSANQKTARQADHYFLLQQHRFRGLVAEFKSRRFVADRTASPPRSFRQGLRELFLLARAAIQPSQFDQFLLWVKAQIDGQLPEISRIPVGYDDLVGVFTAAPVINIEREILWTVARLRAESNRLTEFRLLANSVEKMAFSGDYEGAIQRLRDIELIFGASFWGVQLRIALEYQAGGLERQKRYTAEVRKVHQRGLLGFVTYHTSVRNEDKTTLGKFEEDIDRRLASHQYYEPHVKNYVRFRLTNRLPISQVNLADVLRVEHSHSILDLYETFVSIAQEIVRQENFKSLIPLLSQCLRTLSETEDYRLAKIQLALGEIEPKALHDFIPRDRHGSDAMFLGQFTRGYRSMRVSRTKPEAIDGWQLIYAGLAYSHKVKCGRISSKLKDIPQMIGGVFSASEIVEDPTSVEDPLAHLTKVAINLRALPAIAAVLEFAQQLRRSGADDPWRPWLIGMNSPVIGIEDLAYPASLDDINSITNSNGATANLWKCFYGVNANIEGNAAAALFFAAGMINKGDFDGAVRQLSENNPEVLSIPQRALSGVLLLHAFYSLGDRQNVIALIADEASRSDVARRLLPIASTLRDYTYSDYKLVEKPLAPAIALHLLWMAEDKDSVASQLRFSVGAFLRKVGIDRPSKLIDHLDQFPSHQILYFLRLVCVPHILDVSRVLKSSKEVMEERQAIYASLRVLDSKNSNAYYLEVSAISNQLALDEGQRIVDRTRIHVDADSLLRWAVKAISEDYARYGDLISMAAVTGQNFDDVLKEIAAVPAQKTVFSPEDEADAVLFSMLRRLADEFLTNPSFGLDFYLSQRVRHQSFIGLIRGPLEFANLITTRQSETGSYRANDFWLEKFSTSTDEAKKAISDALDKCATTFDDTLLAAKNKSFHVQSQEKPQGLLSLDLSLQLVSIARVIVTMDGSLREFVATAVALFWAGLLPSLTSVRNFISDELKTKIAEGFDELRATVRKHAEDDPAFLEFDMEVGKRSTEVQRALDDAAGWFTRADIEAQKRIFTLDQAVKIAIETALKSQRAFEPKIERTVESDFAVTASSLVFVHDVLFVALDNVRAHSGLKKPRVNVLVRPDVDAGTLLIEIISDSTLSNRAENIRELKKIRRLIDTGSFGRRSRSEGGSGLIKIAAVVSQSSKGKIEFGFAASDRPDVDRFKISVTYSLLIKSAEEVVDA